jgi:hypothetical protein
MDPDSSYPLRRRVRLLLSFDPANGANVVQASCPFLPRDLHVSARTFSSSRLGELCALCESLLSHHLPAVGRFRASVARRSTRFRRP